MSQFTGGNFTYLRRSKTGDYEHHEATATINFNVDDGDSSGQTFLENAARLATSIVSQALGVANKSAITVPAGSAVPAGEQPASQAPAAAPVPRRRGSAKPPVVDVGPISAAEIAETVAARAAAEITDEGSGVPEITAHPENRTDPANPGDITDDSNSGSGAADGTASQPGVSGSGAGALSTDAGNPAALGEDDWTAPAEVDDKTMLAAITSTQTRLGDALRIRQLIGNYVSKPKGYKDIPAEAREKFLDELGKLE